ncbi:MAG: hypothetical protein A2V90_09465 [Gammaproteobacteria bacterium RBG_16_57_12]|nr:MAG: hypothetical protein A2V90_09465 [Gammaproteobacteria bacterium RBG_16_57_12]
MESSHNNIDISNMPLTRSSSSQGPSKQHGGQLPSGVGEEWRTYKLFLLGIVLGLVILVFGVVSTYYNLAGQGRYILFWLLYRSPLVLLALMLFLELLKKWLDAIDKREGEGNTSRSGLRRFILIMTPVLFGAGMATLFVMLIIKIFAPIY